MVTLGVVACGKPKSAPLDAAVAPHVTVSGRVIDGDAAALVGAQVVARSADGKKSIAVSDERGGFALSLPTGTVTGASDAGAAAMQVQLHVELNGFAPVDLSTTAPVMELEVALVRRIALDGRVLGVDGQPAPNVSIEIMAGTHFSRLITSDDKGRFAIGDLAEAHYALRAVAPTGQAYVPDGSSKAKGERVLRLARTRTANVKLLDDRHQAIDGEVELVELEGPARPRLIKSTAATGARLELLPGHYVATVRAPGTIALNVPVVVEPGPTPLELSWTLPRAATIVGVVVDDAGRPVANAAVRLGGGMPQTGAAILDPRLEAIGELGVLHGPIPFPPLLVVASAPRGASAGQRTDDKGGFRITGVAPGADVVVVEHADFVATRTPFVAVAGAEQNVRCVLGHGELIAVRVTDEKAHPLAQVLLLEVAGTATATTDTTGAASLRVRALPVELDIRAPGFAAARRRISSVDVGGVVEIMLETASDRVIGIVEDERGRIVANAQIQIGGHSEQSDSGGRFVAAGLGRPPWTFVVTHREFPTTTLTTSESSVRIVMPFGGGIDGRVHTPGGEALPSDVVLTLVSGNERTRLTVAGDGRFRRAGVPIGRAEPVATAAGYATLHHALVVPPSESFGEITARDLELELERAVTIHARVRTADRSPANGAVVSVDGQRGTTDPAGDVTITAIGPGVLTILVTEGSESGQVTVEARAGESLTVDVDLE